MLQAEEARERKGNEEQRVEGSGGGVLWWLWDAFLGASPEVTKTESCCGKTFLPFSFFVSPFSRLFFPSEFLVTQGQLRNEGGRYLPHCQP